MGVWGLKLRRICLAALCLTVLLLANWGYLETVFAAEPPTEMIEMVETSPGTLQITNLAAPGTQIPEDLSFKIQVEIGEKLLPEGTSYTVGGERRIVKTAGILFLRAGETAVIGAEHLPGTDYRVTELSAALDGYRPTYEGIAVPARNVICTEDCITGEFPHNGAVHISIINADYDFSVRIPVGNNKGDPTYLIEQVIPSEDRWKTVAAFSEQVATVTGDVIIGYRMDVEGTFYYRITQQQGQLNGADVLLAAVRVADGEAQVTGRSLSQLCVRSR